MTVCGENEIMPFKVIRMRVGGDSPALFAQRAGWAALAGLSNRDKARERHSCLLFLDLCIIKANRKEEGYERDEG